jgi:hypothetical protein
MISIPIYERHAHFTERKIKIEISTRGERNIFNNIKMENILMLKVGGKIF